MAEKHQNYAYDASGMKKRIMIGLDRQSKSLTTWQKSSIMCHYILAARPRARPSARPSARQP